MIYVILAVAALIIGIIIGKVTAKKVSDIKRVEENTKQREINAALDREYGEKLKAHTQQENELRDCIENLTQQKMILSNELAVIQQNVAVQKEQITNEIDNFTSRRIEHTNKSVVQYRQKCFDEVQSELLEKSKISNEKLKELGAQITNLESEIRFLQDSRNALIEVHKREEAEKWQKDFYKIQLNDRDFNDIKLLLSIEPHLYNKDPLYKLIWSTFYMTPVKDMLGRIVGKDKVSGIYKITNQIDGKVYIGQSTDVATRLTNHIKASLGISTIAHQTVHDIMAKKGLENFTFELVESCAKEELNAKEKFWIKTCQSDSYGYNQTAGGS